MRVYTLPAAARPQATAAPVEAPAVAAPGAHRARSPELAAAMATAGELDRDQIGKGCVQWYLTEHDARTARRVEAEGCAPVDQVQPGLWAPELQGLLSDGAADRAVSDTVGAWRRPDDAHDQILAMGVDSLYLAFWTALDPVVVRRLEALRTIARELGDATWIATGPYRWEVAPHGLGGYAVVLTGPTCTLKIARAPSGDTTPQVLVEMRSAWLWRDGPDRCVGTVAAILRGWQGGQGIPRISVSRIDLAVDTTAVQLTGEELAGRRWLTRARGRSQHFHDCAAELGTVDMDQAWGARTAKRGSSSADRRAHSEADLRAAADAAASDHWSGLVYTGVCFGRGATAVRCYRKDWEIRLPGKRRPWLGALWRARGWDGGTPVWRVECQIRSEALRHMVAVGGRGEAPGIVWDERTCSAGAEWATVRRALGALWRYVVGSEDGGGWLTLRDPGRAAQRTRWPVSLGWRAIQAAPWDLGTATGTAGVEVARISPPRQLTKAQQAAAAALPAWGLTPLRPLPPAGPPSLLRLLEGASLVRELGDADLAEELDIDVSCAKAQAAALWPQVVGTWRSWAAAVSVATGHEIDQDSAAMRLILDSGEPEEWAAGLHTSRARRALTLARRATVKRWQKAEACAA